MRLIDMEPLGELSSTGYALTNPADEYLVLEPGDRADPLTATLAAGTCAVEWYSVNSRETVKADRVTVESATIIGFRAPFEAGGPAVLYLKKVGR